MNRQNITVTGDPAIVATWNAIRKQSEQEELAWVGNLRAQGFKAAHPNDGWVDREAKAIYFAYPQFNDGAGIGDMVMLGWHFTEPEELRPVRIVGIKHGYLSNYWLFEDIEQTQNKAQRSLAEFKSVLLAEIEPIVLPVINWLSMRTKRELNLFIFLWALILFALCIFDNGT